MPQLVYHPAFDPYNTLLRVLRLLVAFNEPADRDALRLFDFYLLFPERLEAIRLTPQLRSRVRRLAIVSRFPYDRMPAAPVLLERMNPTFEAALQTLISRGVAKADGRVITLAREATPDALLDLATEQNENETVLIEFLRDLASTFPVHGANGLKDRSGLMEFRYDVV